MRDEFRKHHDAVVAWIKGFDRKGKTFGEFWARHDEVAEDLYAFVAANDLSDSELGACQDLQQMPISMGYEPSTYNPPKDMGDQIENSVVPLDPKSDRTRALHDYLANHAALNAAVLGLCSSHPHLGTVISIPVQPHKGATVNNCWYNAEAASRAKVGKVVFGWALWDGIEGHHAMAQHHAVIERPNGQLVCVSPHDTKLGDLTHITFVRDGRAPFFFDRHAIGFPSLIHREGDQHPFAWRKAKQDLVVEGAWSVLPDNFRLMLYPRDYPERVPK